MVDPELDAEPNYQQVDTNTQNNPQEVEYAIEKVVRREVTPHGLIYGVRWYGYGPPDDKLEPISNLPRNAVARYQTTKQSGSQ